MSRKRWQVNDLEQAEDIDQRILIYLSRGTTIGERNNFVPRSSRRRDWLL
jgi:hypothetical protein